MSLADEVAALRGRSGPPCAVSGVLATLDERDAADLARLLADPYVPATHIGRALRQRGLNVGDPALARHRRGACRCQG